MRRFKVAMSAVLLACFFGSLLQAALAINLPIVPPGRSSKKTLQASGKQVAKFKPDQVVPFKEIALEKGEPKKTKLNLYVFNPKDHQATDQAPAIVFFFGGGWKGGTPKQFYEQARFFADHGFVAISAEYRVKSRNKATPFDCVQDGKSAIRWVRSHAKKLGIDPAKVVAAGGSAGGHVAACTGIIHGHEGKDEDPKVSSVPNAMVLINPVIDTTENGYGAERFTSDRQTEISPNHHIRPGIVPTILFHGTADATVPIENAERFTKLMKEAGNICELKAVEGKGHGFFNGKFFRKKTKDTSGYERSVKESLEFLNEQGFVVKK